MKLKKLVSLFSATALAVSGLTGIATTASAASASDIVPISTSSTYWFDSYMSDGLSKGDLIGDSHFYTPTGNSYANNKGKTENHYNCLRLKYVQNMLQFSVAEKADITIYTQSHDKRGVVVTSTVPSSEYTYDSAKADTSVLAVQEVSTSSLNFSVDAATDICLSSYSGDFYIAGVKVDIKTTVPQISVSPTKKTINVGDTTEITATTQNIGDATVVWSSSNPSVATVDNGTVNALAAGETTITAAVTVDGEKYEATAAITVQDVATVTYVVGEGIEGKAPSATTVTKGNEITVPVNNSLYVEDKTLTGWTDGENTYAPGEKIVLNADTTLSPVFTDNTVALGDDDATVTFYFGEVNGAPTIAVEGVNNPSAIIVTQAVINGTSIDVKLDIDASNGKFNNSNRNDVWAQVNGGTIINVPVLAGSVVTLMDIWNDEGTYTIGGSEYVGDNGSYTATEEGNVAIVAGKESGGYWNGITVTYPKTVTKTYPTVDVTRIGIFTNKGSEPAAAFTGSFTVGENNKPVNRVTWTVGEKTADVDFPMMSGGSSVVVGLIVKGEGADAAKPTATTSLFVAE